MTGPVLHIVPSGVLANQYHGSYKDTISRVRWLEPRFPEHVRLEVHEDDPGRVFKELPATPPKKVLIEYSTFPKIVKSLRKRFPSSLIAIRSHNIEPLQHRDNHGWWPKRGPLWMAYGMGRLLASDITCRRYADVIYSISDWEIQAYWSKLPGKARLEWLPYHCPDHLLPNSIQPVGERRIIACLPTSQKNRKSWDLVKRFYQLAEQCEAHVPGRYEYLVTGRLSDWGLPKSRVVRQVGMVDDLNAFLQTCRAVCQLSPLGYGFKTTIGDAIAHGCTVLIHPQLHARCPKDIHTALASVDTDSADASRRCLDSLEHIADNSSLDARLREMSEKLLTFDLLGGDPSDRCHEEATS